jgi:hypothetical protein
LLNPAIKGVNSVDNLEKVEIDNPSGTYTVRVSHKGILEQAQPYSLIISSEGSSALSLTDNLNVTKDELTLYKLTKTPKIKVSTLNREVSFNSYSIYNIVGKELMYKDFEDSKTVDFTFSTNGYSKGVYLIKVYTSKDILVKKFTVN